MKETNTDRAQRIISQLKQRFPHAQAYDLDGRGEHFLAEIEPVSEHPAFDRAIEVIINSKPHKHLKMTQEYTILSGTLELHADDEVVILTQEEKYIIKPNTVHWARSQDECWVEIYSRPGWTKEDHILE